MRSSGSLFKILITLTIVMFLVNGCLDQLISPGSDSASNSNDEFEPDNSPSKSTEIGEETQEHTIFNEDGNYDIDYVKFNVVSGGGYRVRIFDVEGFNPEVTLYGLDGSTEVETKSTEHHTGKYNWLGYDEYNNFYEVEKESIVFKAQENGVYYLSVKDLNKSGTGKYKIGFSEVDIIDSVTIIAKQDTSDFKIDLQWNTLNNVDGYCLYRVSNSEINQSSVKSGADRFKLVAKLSETEYSDRNIEHGEEYCYIVKGYTNDLLGYPSNKAKAIFDWRLFEPAEDDIITLKGTSDEINITLSKKINYDKIVEYNIYRSNKDNGDTSDFTPVNKFKGTDPLGKTIYDKKEIVHGKVYYYYLGILIRINDVDVISRYAFIGSVKCVSTSGD